MTELEYKAMLSEESFAVLLENSLRRYGKSQVILQTNYYYDDMNLSLNRRGITVRVRQIGGKNILQIKRHGVAEIERASCRERV